MTSQRPPMSTCRSCSEPIIWCKTVFDKRIPVDVEPTESGNLLLSEHRPVPVASVVSRTGRPTGQKLHIGHFATCRNADQHRRPKADQQSRPPVQQDALFGSGDGR